MSVLDREIDVLRTERDAFETFERRLKEASPHRPRPPSAAQAASVTCRQLDADNWIQHLYQQTVMATDHYKAEYAEPAMENIRIELGPEVAEYVRSAQSPSASGVRAVRVAVSEAVHRRDRLLDLLNDERAALDEWDVSITTVRRAIRGIETREPRTYDAQWDRLSDLQSVEKTLDDLIVRRQQQLAAYERGLTTPTGEAMEFGAYLYADSSVKLPVLAETLEDLAAVRIQVERCLIHPE